MRPGRDPLPEGEVGEIVVTTLNTDYPLIRFGTGDMSAVMPGISPRWGAHQHPTPWMGRADQRTKARHVRRHPQETKSCAAIPTSVARRRQRRRPRPHAALRCEVDETGHALAQAIVESLRDVTKLRGEAAFEATGSRRTRMEGDRGRAGVIE